MSKMSLVKLLPARVKEFLLLDPGMICSTKVQRNLRNCCNKLEIFEASSRSGRLVSGTVLIFQVNKAWCFTQNHRSAARNAIKCNGWIDWLLSKPYHDCHGEIKAFPILPMHVKCNQHKVFILKCLPKLLVTGASLSFAKAHAAILGTDWESFKITERKSVERQIVFYTGLSGFQTRCSTDENIWSLKLHRCFFVWAQAHYALDLLVAKEMDSKMVKQIPGGHLLTNEKRLRKYFQVVTDALTMTQFGISFQTWPCDWEMTSTVCVQTRRPSWPKGWFQIVFWWQNGTSKLSYHFIPIEV